MPAPQQRYGVRGSQFIRQWRVLVLLRQAPRTLDALARACECTTRTTRRDLDVLRSAGLPVLRQEPYADGDPAVWRLDAVPAWPRGIEAPIQMPDEEERVG